MIQLNHITKRFASLTAVDDVCLSVNAGEFLTLLGPSGCGKTTLLRMISGFETPDSGAVLLDHHDVTRLPPYKRDVNQVFQSYALFPHMSVYKNVAFGLRMRRLPKAQIKDRVEHALNLVSLAGLEDRKPSQLSGGQQQRVALARAIVCQPKVLLLDEPLSALDARLRQSMQVELKHLQKRLGITFVFVTHDQSEAMVMSDRICLMNKGKIEQLGPPTDVYLKPQTPFAAQFLGTTNLLSPAFLSTFQVPNSAFRSAIVRPEKIHVSLTPLPNSFPAETLETIFDGPTTRLRVRTAAGTELQILTLNDKSQIPAPNQTIHCTIDPQDIVFI